MNNGSMFFGGGFMWIFWLLLIFVIVFVLKAAFDNTSPGERTTALDILNKRYARGEIDEEEYERRRAELEK